MATYPKIVTERLASLRRMYEADRKRYLDAVPQYKDCLRVVSAAPNWVDGEVVRNLRVQPWLSGAKVILRADVKNFRDIGPLLELVEAQGYTFTESCDWPAASERTYTATSLHTDEPSWNAPGIVVEAHLDGEGEAGCRRRIAGYRESPPQPIYEFDCGDPAAIIPAHEDEDVPQ